MSQSSRLVLRLAAGFVSRSQVGAARRLLVSQPTRAFANRFNRRPSAASSSSSSAPARSTALSTEVMSGVQVEGTDAQLASVRLRPNSSYKVDPASIIAVPAGVEVRPVYGAPQPQMQMQQQTQQQQATSGVGGFLSRFREPSPQQQQQQSQSNPTAPVLMEVSLQEGFTATQDPVQLGAPTASKLQSVDLADYGGEMYITLGSFLAGQSSANLYNVEESSGIPGVVLQRVEGQGQVLLKVAGQPIVKDLAPGEQMYVQGNRMVAVESSVQVLGGEGLLVTLVGPGRVLLQSLPSLEVALTNQAVNMQQALVANGMAAPNNALMSPFGGGMGTGLGGMVMQGMAFGVGSSLAHHAIGSMMGGGHHSAPPPADNPAAEQPPAEDPYQAGQPDQMYSDLPPDNSSDNGGGSFFGSMFGGDEDGDDGGDSDW